MESLVGFSSWREVLDYAGTGAPLYYKAPMDHRATRLRPVDGTPFPPCYEVRARTIKIWPYGSVGRGRNRTADPFTADSGHLGRFSRPDTAAQSGEYDESWSHDDDSEESRHRRGMQAPRAQQADPHAAHELVLYIENTSDLSPDGPRGQGRDVLLNALRKWRKGTYDPALAVKLFGYLVETGAKRYSKEFGSSEREWSTMFNVPTRQEAARQLEASFRSSAENGEYDHVVSGRRAPTGSGSGRGPALREASRGKKPDQRAVDFFYKHAGYGHGPGETPEQGRKRGAIALAKAEQEAAARGWRVEWSEDPEGWDSLGDIDPDDVREILQAVLYDEEGNVLGSLGSIVNPDRNYSRVVEAEIALEALPSSGRHADEHGGRRAVHEASRDRMDSFTSAYLETALWASMDNSDDNGGEPLDRNYSISDIADETRDKMIADCADFQHRYKYMLDNAYGEGGIDSERAGHNFWLSRNGHGAGFFDDDLDDLQDAAKSYGEFDLYIGDDGEIHGG